MHMYTPKVEKLWEPGVWLDAATQVFYSFGLAFGSLIAFGSYNTPKNNCVRDVFLVSVCNAVTGENSNALHCKNSQLNFIFFQQYTQVL